MNHGKCRKSLLEQNVIGNVMFWKLENGKMNKVLYSNES